MSPKPTARPCSAVAVVNSTAVRPRLGPGRAARDVDVDRGHVAQVDDEATVGRAVAGAAVPAAADGERQACLAGIPDRARHVGVVHRPDDDGRPRIGAAEHDGARTVVPLVGRADHAAADLGLQLRQGDRGHGRCSFAKSVDTGPRGLRPSERPELIETGGTDIETVIEPERESDHQAVRRVVAAAFADHPEVADLVELIRASPQYEPELALVARRGDEVVGHVMISHAELVEDGLRLGRADPVAAGGAAGRAAAGRRVGAGGRGAAAGRRHRRGAGDPRGEPGVLPAVRVPRRPRRWASRSTCRTGRRGMPARCTRSRRTTPRSAAGWSTRPPSPRSDGG